MKAPELIIRKRMQLIQGKVRPCCFAQAIVDPQIQAKLDEHFAAETLFKRASYSVAWPKTAIEIPPALAPSLSTFLKNDACPEVTVKTMLTGQLHQGASAWDMLCFELIAKLSFDNLLALVAAVRELDQDVVFSGSGHTADIAAFEADARADGQTPSPSYRVA